MDTSLLTFRIRDESSGTDEYGNIKFKITHSTYLMLVEALLKFEWKCIFGFLKRVQITLKFKSTKNFRIAN